MMLLFLRLAQTTQFLRLTPQPQLDSSGLRLLLAV